MDTIECKICGKMFKMLDKHLYFKHNVSVTDYKIRFPEAPIVSQSVLERRNKTISKGVKCFWKQINPEAKKIWTVQRKQGCMRKYGVDHISYVREIRRKAEMTLRKNLGDDCYLEIWNKGQPKRKKTMMEKYGVINPMSNEVLAEKAIKSHIFPTSPEKLLNN